MLGCLPLRLRPSPMWQQAVKLMVPDLTPRCYMQHLCFAFHKSTLTPLVFTANLPPPPPDVARTCCARCATPRLPHQVSTWRSPLW
jgi:hypothetical protein